MDKQKKPNWITDEQWEANPNIFHWERSREAMHSLKQLQEQPPLTREEVEQQMQNRKASIRINKKF